MTEHQMIGQFLEILQELPGVDVGINRRGAEGSNGNRRYDATIDLQVGGKSIALLIEVKKTVYPRDIHQLLWKFRDVSDSRPERQGNEPLLLLIAESISLGAKELLKKERIGYYDSGGSLYLPAPGAYLYIDKPPPKSLVKSVRSLFSGRRALVLHALLARHQDWFSVKDLAQQVMVSPATTSQVLTELERFDWVVSRGQGPNKERHLREPTALLDAWMQQFAASVRQPNLRRYYVPAIQAATLLERVGEIFNVHHAEYAISYEAAAQRYAPFLSSVSQVRARLLIGKNADAAIADLGARMVNEGANLIIIDAQSPNELLFREQIGDIWLASPVQVYLDLIHGEGRSKEMAEHLRKERIGF